MDKKVFIEHREKLVALIKEHFPKQEGAIFLWANFEQDLCPFMQESTFYYFTGITESAVALRIELSGKTTLFVPHTHETRKKWVSGSFEKTPEDCLRAGVDAIEYFGKPIVGYSLSPLFSEQDYESLLIELEKSEHVFTAHPSSGFNYAQQMGIINRLKQMRPSLNKKIIDISSLVAQLRRNKDKHEITELFNAIKITTDALVSVSELIHPNITERDIKAGIAYVMNFSGVQEAFPTIVGTGKNATILHYGAHDATLKKNELVIIDCGACCNHYCADLTRTFPVSGKFNKRQRELYGLVLECQDLVASKARPGIWLNNKEKPTESLYHIAVDFFSQKGYEKYFIHGIGHFLGLDAHDVGNYAVPLQEGDVITLEPGLYIPEEEIGIRIEDNYWIIKDGAHCLSEEMPKAIEDIEELLIQTK